MGWVSKNGQLELYVEGDPRPQGWVVRNEERSYLYRATVIIWTNDRWVGHDVGFEHESVKEAKAAVIRALWPPSLKARAEKEANHDTDN